MKFLSKVAEYQTDMLSKFQVYRTIRIRDINFQNSRINQSDYSVLMTC